MKMKKNEAEVRARWGNTDAYREHTQKTKQFTKEQWAGAEEGLMAIFAEFAACREHGDGIDSAEAQAIAAGLQEYITQHFYTCTTEILSGLGAMYTADGRFRRNIDQYGSGTAEYASAVIDAYCKKRLCR